MIEVQCYDGDGLRRRPEFVRLEVVHFAFTKHKLGDHRYRAHVIVQLFGDHDEAVLKDAVHEPMDVLELRYLQGERSISAKFHALSISRMKKQFNGWNVRVHCTSIEESDVFHG